jgi:NAD+ synthase
MLAALPSDLQEMAMANIKPRLRMAALYALAQTNSYLVAGTGNASELMVGYFTKYGDGGVDVEPLGNLYKWQVRGLAAELGVPQSIIDRPPSAGLWDGQTDEGELGMTYDELDAALVAISEGEAGDTEPTLLSRVERLIAASAHKRAMPPACPV